MAIPQIHLHRCSNRRRSTKVSRSELLDHDMLATDDDAVKRRLKEMEEEDATLCEMQAKVEKEMGVVQGGIEALIMMVLNCCLFTLFHFGSS
ncbi:unnamed protein product [Arabidopsis arenosa]|uniref:Uncharacterized protein n=1 Tax=Arabidopsis arenosa TaxID=38785 RepID=A0A8S2A7I6_ARAAE|nr:unnamed protein product [Arabidopsis arenosa]